MQDIPKVIPIKKVIKETEFVKTFVFDYKLGGQPGQFVNVWIPRVNEKPMSIAYCDEKEFWITVFAVGDFSKKLHTLKAGDMVGIRGPYGKGFSFKPKQHLVMMAGGYGAAPLYYLTVEAAKKGCKIDFVIGARGKEHLLYLERIGKLKNVKIHVTTDDGSAGIKGYNTVILQKLIDERRKAKIDCVYTCGPEMMMKKISDMCFEAKIDAQISIERYMKCGFGVCGQCCVDGTGEPMCKNGPVVSNAHARKIAEFGKYHRDSVGRIHNF
jgi:dihydroorotate dehydrogenase electron transfer subunit